MLASPQVLLPSMHDKSQTTAARTVLAIQPGASDGAQEELAAVGVGPRVGHGQHAGAVMLQGEVLVGKHLAVDGLAAGAVARREVAALPMHARLIHTSTLQACTRTKQCVQVRRCCSRQQKAVAA